MRNTPGIRGFIDLGRAFILLGPLSIIVIAIAVSGCDKYDLPGIALYDIQVSGLDGLNGSGNTRIYIPLPMEGDVPLIPSNESPLFYANSDISWSSRIVDTQYGTMYCLYTNNTSLVNISAHIAREFINISYEDELGIINRTETIPLAPVSNGTPLYTGWLSSRRNYTSYIYLDGITPVENRTIKFKLELTVSDRMTAGQRSVRFEADIIEYVPANVSGWVPVTVQIW